MNEIQPVYGMFNLRKKRELAEASYEYITRDVNDIKTNIIRFGFHLMECKENKYYEDYGFNNFYEFVEKNWKLGKSTVSRYINLFMEFSLCQDGRHKIFLDNKYEGYSYSQLSEMLPLSDKQRKQIKPEMTITEIRELKKSWKKEKQSPSRKNIETECEEIQNDIENIHTEIELIKPDEKGEKYLNAAAKKIILVKREWMLEDFEKRVLDISTSPDELKQHLGIENRTWYFPLIDGDEVGHINFFNDYVQLWDEQCNFLGNYKWFYFAKAILVMWNIVAEEEVATSQQKEEIIVDVGCQEISKLPVLKNDNQRKEFIEDYQNWQIWIDIPQTGERYWKYELDNGVKLVVKAVLRKAYLRYQIGYAEEKTFGAEEYYLFENDNSAYEAKTNKSGLVKYLKEYQKNG